MRKLIVLTCALFLFAGTAFAADTAKTEAAYNGYCPVAFVAEGKAMKGTPEFSATFEGQTFWLANRDAKRMFEANPEKYVVAFGGHAADELWRGNAVMGDPTIFAVTGGNTYFFSSEKGKNDFMKDSSKNILAATTNYKTHIAGIEKEVTGTKKTTTY
jgi:YHS domain-containing protein